MTKDIVDQLDAMYTDKDSGVNHPLVTLEAANEITRLRSEIVSLNELVADALPKLTERLKLRAENKKLATWLMHPYVFVHERIIEELDKDLAPYHGKATPAI